MEIINILYVLLMTLFGAIGGYFFKKASDHQPGINVPFLTTLGTGGMFYLIGALLNIYLLKILPYTIVYPITSVTYIWTMVLSYFLLSETITTKKLLGVLFISGGSILLVL